MMLMTIPPIIPTSISSALLAYVFASTSIITTTTKTIPSTTTTVFEFGNVGSSVRIDNPLQFRSELLPPPPLKKNNNNNNNDNGKMTLVDPQFLGAGGGGAVFSYSIRKDRPIMGSTTIDTSTMESTMGRNTVMNSNNNNNNNNGDDVIISNSSNDNNNNDKVVVKYSWIKSADSVRNECNVLRIMEQRGVRHGVERCLGIMAYPDDPRRVMIVMEPLITGDVSSTLEDTHDDPIISTKVVTTLMKTMAQMLVEGIVTTDIQLLYSKTTGDVLLIDMTEAVVVIDGGGEEEQTTRLVITDIDRALINGFCTEMITLIPDKYLDVAAESFSSEMLVRIDQRGVNGPSSPSSSSASGTTHRFTIIDNADVKEILKSLPITTGPLLDYLDE